MTTRRQFSLALASGSLAAVFSLPWLAARAAPGWTKTLENEFARLEAEIKGRFGACIIDTASGEQASHKGDERFAMCSTFKVLAAGALLERVDAGKESLTRRIQYAAADLVTYSPATQKHAGADGMTLAEICEAAITLSDNTAGNLILRQIGGPQGVTDFARTLGDAVTRLDRFETELNEARPGDPRDTTTPNAMAANLRKLTLGSELSEGSRKQLADWLLASKTGGAKLRAGLPKDWRVGDKTGGGGTGTTNDIAVIWPPSRAPMIACVFITQTTSSVDDCNKAIASVGRAIAAAFGA